MRMIDTAYILAGGRSRRLGRDKRFLECGGDSLLMRTVKSCREVLPNVKLVAKQVGALNKSGCEIVLDWPHADGPLAGVIAALEDCAKDCCFVTAVDLYDLDQEIISRLIKSYSGEQYFGIQEPNGGQPLCGVYDRSALHFLMLQGKAGKYQMRDAIAGLECGWLESPVSPWRNINAPDDLNSIGYTHG